MSKISFQLTRHSIEIDCLRCKPYTGPQRCQSLCQLRRKKEPVFPLWCVRNTLLIWIELDWIGLVCVCLNSYEEFLPRYKTMGSNNINHVVRNAVRWNATWMGSHAINYLWTHTIFTCNHRVGVCFACLLALLALLKRTTQCVRHLKIQTNLCDFESIPYWRFIDVSCSVCFEYVMMMQHRKSGIASFVFYCFVVVVIFCHDSQM